MDSSTFLIVALVLFGGAWISMILGAILKRLAPRSRPLLEDPRVDRLQEEHQQLEARFQQLEEEVGFLRELHEPRSPAQLPPSDEGLGVGCSDGCDLSGESLGVGASFLVNRVGIGGGLGVLHRSGRWRFQPHGQISVAHGIFRAQGRAEVPTGGVDPFIAILFGARIPIG